MSATTFTINPTISLSKATGSKLHLTDSCKSKNTNEKVNSIAAFAGNLFTSHSLSRSLNRKSASYRKVISAAKPKTSSNFTHNFAVHNACTGTAVGIASTDTKAIPYPICQVKETGLVKHEIIQEFSRKASAPQLSIYQRCGSQPNILNCAATYTPERKSNCVDCIKDLLYQPITTKELCDKVSKADPSQIVILDVRENRFYQTEHIRGSRSFSCYTKTMLRKAKASWNCLERQKNVKEIIIYDQKGMVNTDDPAYCFIKFLSEKVQQIFLLEGGFESFRTQAPNGLTESCICEEKIKQYHYSPTNLVNHSEDVLNATISQILPFLYLGNERDSQDRDMLENHGITHILNVTNIVPFHLEKTKKFIYHRLPASDNQLQNLRAFYDEAFDFIDNARLKNGKVLVHCWAGVSRSASIVIAYIMRHTQLDMLSTMEFVRSKRKVIAPNFHFMGQLEKFGKDFESGLEQRSLDRFHDVEKEAINLDAIKDSEQNEP